MCLEHLLQVTFQGTLHRDQQPVRDKNESFVWRDVFFGSGALNAIKNCRVVDFWKNGAVLCKPVQVGSVL